MTVSGLAAIAFAFGGLAILSRSRRTGRWVEVPWLVGLAGFLVVLIGAWSLPLGQRAVIGSETLQSTGYLRLLLMLLAAAGGTMTFVAMAVRGSRSIPGVALLWYSTATVALAMVSPIPAILILTGGSIAAVMLAVDAGGPERSMVAARGLRAIVVAGFLAALAIGWADIAAQGLRAGIGDAGAPPDGGALGLAYLAGAVAIALRAGAIPLHLWSSRLAERLPLLSIPITFAWGPAVLAIVILGWADPAVLALGQPLALERAVVGLVAVVSIMFGALAAYLHDDLEHVLSYSLVADTGVVLLGVAAASAEAWAPVRVWILAYLVAKSALAAWVLAVRATFGTSRIPELGGWARRAPLLAGGLILIGLTAVGVPGLAAFDARARLIDLALDPPFSVVALLGALASAGYYVRLLVVGFGSVSPTVSLAANVAPDWPGGRPARLWPDLARQLPGAWRVNRAPAAASAVLVLAMLGLAVAGGALHATGAAAAPPPGAGSTEETASPSPSSSGPAPSLSPAGSGLPGSSVVPAGSAPSAPSSKAPAAPSGSPDTSAR